MIKAILDLMNWCVMRYLRIYLTASTAAFYWHSGAFSFCLYSLEGLTTSVYSRGITCVCLHIVLQMCALFVKLMCGDAKAKT